MGTPSRSHDLDINLEKGHIRYVGVDTRTLRANTIYNTILSIRHFQIFLLYMFREERLISYENVGARENRLDLINLFKYNRSP